MVWFCIDVLLRACTSSLALFEQNPRLLLLGLLGAIITAGLVFVFRGREAFMEHLKANIAIAFGGAIVTWMLVVLWTLIWMPHTIRTESEALPLPILKEIHPPFDWDTKSSGSMPLGARPGISAPDSTARGSLRRRALSLSTRVQAFLAEQQSKAPNDQAGTIALYADKFSAEVATIHDELEARCLKAPLLDGLVVVNVTDLRLVSGGMQEMRDLAFFHLPQDDIYIGTSDRQLAEMTLNEAKAVGAVATACKEGIEGGFFSGKRDDYSVSVARQRCSTNFESHTQTVCDIHAVIIKRIPSAQTEKGEDDFKDYLLAGYSHNSRKTDIGYSLMQDIADYLKTLGEALRASKIMP